jgi:Trypsin-like peptidase domain
MIAFTSHFSLSCGTPNPIDGYRSTLLGKVGASDAQVLTSTSSPPWALRTAMALGWLSTRCTAFHIGQGYAVTAGHCVNALKSEARGKLCEGINISWISPESLELGAPQPCRRIIIEQGRGDSDYAILRFDTAPAAQLPLAGRVGETSRPVQLVGFAHGQLTYSENCMASWEAGPPGVWRHDCDTEPGDSGAPLLNVPDQEVIGIHRGFRDGFNRALDARYVQARADAVGD